MWSLLCICLLCYGLFCTICSLIFLFVGLLLYLPLHNPTILLFISLLPKSLQLNYEDLPFLHTPICLLLRFLIISFLFLVLSLIPKIFRVFFWCVTIRWIIHITMHKWTHDVLCLGHSNTERKLILGQDKSLAKEATAGRGWTSNQDRKSAL